MLRKIVYVLPALIVNPFVSLNDGLSMSAADCQWLTDSIQIHFQNITFKTFQKLLFKIQLYPGNFQLK